MPFISNKGSTASRIWVVLKTPFSSDIPHGVLLSGGMGNIYTKMFLEAGISPSDCYFCSRIPNTDDTHAFANVDGMVNQFQPPIVLAIGDVAGWFLPELREKNTGVETSKGQLQKYAGSLLESPALKYPHYCIPLYGPDRCVQDWAERNITTYVDLQKIRDEFKYWKEHGQLKKLPERTLKYGNLNLDEILQWFNSAEKSKLISVDIETVYPRMGSIFLPHPGYPVTVGLADSAISGISFNLFRDNPEENRTLWRALDSLFRKVRILGQNFFNFDALFLEALGFKIGLSKCEDTLIRHHILWPELSHKLQFMTRQYTREPYYKDEGHGWSIKYMDKLRRYNCLDVCVTYEIYEAQEEEFKQRPHLR